MQSYIALFRGINVSGQKKIIMKDLISYMEEIGLKNLKTYIQSGNLSFLSELNSIELVKLIQAKIETEYRFFAPVIIFTKEEINKLVEQNPYVKTSAEIKYLYITFLSDYPENKLVENIKKIKFNNDEFIISDRIIYGFLPGGYGKTKINNNFFENKLKVSATTRNWKTALKLKEMVNEPTG